MSDGQTDKKIRGMQAKDERSQRGREKKMYPRVCNSVEAKRSDTLKKLHILPSSRQRQHCRTQVKEQK